MTFQKTSLALLLALPLAATAVDSPPPPPEPVSSIPGIPLLQAVKDAFSPSTGKKNTAKKPSAVRGNVLKQDGKNLEEHESSPPPCIEELGNQISEVVASGRAEEIDLFPYGSTYRIEDTDKLTIHIACDKNILRLCAPIPEYKISQDNSYLSVSITDGHKRIMGNINSKGFKIIPVEKIKLDKKYLGKFRTYFSIHLSKSTLPIYEIYFYDICPQNIFSTNINKNTETIYVLYIPQREGTYIFQDSKDAFKKFFGSFNNMATPFIDL